MYGGVFKKRPREDAVDAALGKPELTASCPLPITVHHYPSHLPFPTTINDSFPAEGYKSRGNSVKAAIHWGQRKLLLSEIQLLTLYARRDTSYHVVYVGSAPGTHLAILDEMFDCRHTWELVDPGRFDREVLEPRPNFTLRNEFFTNATAYGINARRLLESYPNLGALYRYIAVDSVQPVEKEVHQHLQVILGTLDVARGTESIPSMFEPPLQLPLGFSLICGVAMERCKPILFVSDIRSGSVNLPNFEQHVSENMKAQECWCQIIDGEYSMLKFRLPYTHKSAGIGDVAQKLPSSLIKSDGTVSYLSGDILLPIWTRPTSTEGRLVVPRGSARKNYNVEHVENQFFFFNARLREQVHFNHILLPDANLDHHYDAAAEVNCILAYVKFMHPNLADAPVDVLRREVKRVSRSITTRLRTTFRDAILRRDALVLKLASNGAIGEEEGDESDGEEHECSGTTERRAQVPKSENSPWVVAAKRMIQAAAKERSRVLWWRNIPESDADEPSGLWVTTRMKQ
ncbi:putative Poly A polymerase regulatory subunit [Trypanosoma vivax]|uniref:Cap-specific mRNA (nucleoside-2'-O-)-methyltransferase n=1 Tax=Trypanosoma vivax (strain Y486) TaxID=1055687 RepID=G0U391_TRYVY|nr:hypothetical protein TRVL_09196 [Trypanosoma vivax]KAH8604212.1 putative Poly A polymerase regulatory subunit [Trypanosoma vivax]CCC50747.1 conserved hypothetical protein [Trypanosoma vivax Y486]